MYGCARKSISGIQQVGVKTRMNTLPNLHNKDSATLDYCSPNLPDYRRNRKLNFVADQVDSIFGSFFCVNNSERGLDSVTQVDKPPAFCG